jgi:O-antigen/teichoic acid export membrane protein
MKEIFQSNFAKNLLFVAGGTIFAQISGLLAMPIITRIYSPEQYGLLTIYVSVLTLFSGSECLRYELGIPIADDDESAINIVALSIMILFSFTFLFIITISVFGKHILVYLSAEKIQNYRFLLPFGLFLNGLFQIFLMWNFRKKDYQIISRTKIAQSLAGNISKIGFGLLGFGPVGLIIGNTVGRSAGATTLMKKLVINQKELIGKIKFSRMVYLSKRYIKFPIFKLPSTFLSKTANQLPILFIASIYGGEVIGLFGLAKSIVNMPVLLIGKSVGDVFYGEVAALGRNNPKRIKHLSEKLFKKLCLLGAVPLFTLLFFGPALFGLVFGPEWITAGKYARILAVLSFAELIFQPVSRIYDIFEKQQITLVITIIRIILVLGVFAVSKIVHLDLMITILLYVSVMVFIHFLTFILAKRILSSVN